MVTMSTTIFCHIFASSFQAKFTSILLYLSLINRLQEHLTIHQPNSVNLSLVVKNKPKING